MKYIKNISIDIKPKPGALHHAKQMGFEAVGIYTLLANEPNLPLSFFHAKPFQRRHLMITYSMLFSKSAIFEINSNFENEFENILFTAICGEGVRYINHIIQ